MAPNLEIESGDDLVRLTVESGIPYRSYNDLTDIPKINNVSVKGSLSLNDLGIENSKIYIADLNYDNSGYSLAGTYNDIVKAAVAGKVIVVRCAAQTICGIGQFSAGAMCLFYSQISVDTLLNQLRAKNFEIRSTGVIYSEKLFELTPKQ